MSNDSSVPQFTLEQVNARLTKHGLPPIAQNQIEVIRQHATREDILRAVADLGFVPAAQEFLTEKMKAAGIIQPQRSPARGQPIEQATGGPQLPNFDLPEESQAPDRQPSAAPPQRQGEKGNAASKGHNSQNRPAPSSPRPSSPASPSPSAPAPPQSGSGANSPAGEGQGVPEGDRMSVHVYARNNAALCFEADVARSGFQTIALDGAKAAGTNFDWKNKTRIQLTKGEVPEVLAVLSGHSRFCEFKNHGPSNNKGFSMERQGEKVYVTIFEKGKPLIGVPIHPNDMFYVYSLFMKRVSDENPWLDPLSILSMVKTTQAVREAPPQNNAQRTG